MRTLTIDGKKYEVVDANARKELLDKSPKEHTHNDIILLFEGLSNRLNAIADSDDATLDQMSEIVAYIKENKSLIDSVTTKKVSVEDIIDNLTTSVSNRPLSAKQGQILKNLIDKIIVPTKLSQLENDAEFISGLSILEGFATKDEIPKDYAKENHSHDGYAPVNHEHSEYLKSIPDVYAKISDIPTDFVKNSEFNSHKTDSSHVTSAEKAAWNAKSDFSGLYADLKNKPTIPSTPSQVGADPTGTAESKVAGHNTNEEAHNDIRLLIEGLSSRLNALANSDDTTLDQMAEVVAYIKNNKSLIDGISTSKVNVTDIIDNLTTSVTNKPLSAKQGVVLKGLIDAITVPSKVSELENDSNFVTETNLSNKKYVNETKFKGHEDDTTMHVTSVERETWNAKSDFSGSYNDLTNKPAHAVYATCETAAATAEKVVTTSGNNNWSLSVGSVVMVYFTTSNSASNVKLNVNGSGAYPIWYNNAEYTSTGTQYTGYAKRVINYMFNGTHWVWIGSSYDSNTTYKNVSLGHGYVTCDTAASTTAKVGTLASYALTVGGIVAVKFTYAVPANATLNINSKGAKNMFYRGAKITAGVINAGDIATFIYDGTQYQLLTIDRVNTETWTFTLEDGSEVTKKVVVG